MNPYRERSRGTDALECGIRMGQPPPAPPAPLHESAASQPFMTASLRPVVSRFGGILMESHAVHIPVQTSAVSVGAADNDNDFESRHKPEVTNVFAGIPGYTGYKPHGAHHKVLGSSAAPPAHAGSPVGAADTSKQPYIMPVVGYGGHVRGLADANKNYGATHWKNSGQVNPHRVPASSLPWDGRDIAGRPFGGQTPGDFGQYKPDPEYERKRLEAEEANEILELRSMGIRARLEDIHKQNSRGTAKALPNDGRREARLQALEHKLGVDKVQLDSMGMQIDTTAWGVSKQQDLARKNGSFQ